MASFGWKRKIGEKVSKVTSQQFEAEAADEKGLVENEDVNWLHAIKRKKAILLEDCTEKSKRLKDEGAILAENRRSLYLKPLLLLVLQSKGRDLSHFLSVRSHFRGTGRQFTNGMKHFS
uniref:Tetratricopeptide repeat domain 33 n=1 Tax=Monodelphis domestica TaxID=13616 RepID=A0A5F8H7R3_MONDO